MYQPTQVYPLQKLRLASVTSSNQSIVMTSTGSPAPVNAVTFEYFGRELLLKLPDPFRGASLQGAIMNGTTASYINMAPFALQDTAGTRVGSGATYAAGGVGDSITIAVAGFSNSVINLATVAATQLAYITAINAGLTGARVEDFNGQLRIVTNATGALATGSVVSFGGAAAAKTGLSVGAFTPGVVALPAGTGVTIAASLTLQVTK